jgi:hypothetical protein
MRLVMRDEPAFAPQHRPQAPAHRFNGLLRQIVEGVVIARATFIGNSSRRADCVGLCGASARGGRDPAGFSMKLPICIGLFDSAPRRASSP